VLSCPLVALSRPPRVSNLSAWQPKAKPLPTPRPCPIQRWGACAFVCFSVDGVQPTADLRQRRLSGWQLATRMWREPAFCAAARRTAVAAAVGEWHKRQRWRRVVGTRPLSLRRPCGGLSGCAAGRASSAACLRPVRRRHIPWDAVHVRRTRVSYTPYVVHECFVHECGSRVLRPAGTSVFGGPLELTLDLAALRAALAAALAAQPPPPPPSTSPPPGAPSPPPL
jgi:hypothetical protein